MRLARPGASARRRSSSQCPMPVGRMSHCAGHVERARHVVVVQHAALATWRDRRTRQPCVLGLRTAPASGTLRPRSSDLAAVGSLLRIAAIRTSRRRRTGRCRGRCCRTGARSCRGSCRTPACVSATELLITCSTSAVAVCCSSASVVSLSRRTFSIAMTAWSAKVSSRSAWRVGVTPGSARRR